MNYLNISGKCYKTQAGQSQFKNYFEFPRKDKTKVRSTPYSSKVKKISWCVWNCEYEDKITFPYFNTQWYDLRSMGHQHIQTSHGVVFNTPYASRHYSHSNGYEYTRRYEGTIVHQFMINNTNPFFVVAEGKNLWDRFDGTYSAMVSDPHWCDQTGASFAKGNFFKFNQDLEHFVVGAPNADRLQGRVYICHDCFGTKSKRNGRQLQAPNPQHGERFGAAVAAVDINGDGYDDVVVGAPLHNQLSTVLTNLPKMFFS